MPYLTEPQGRHRGQAVKTIERHGRSITVGLVYDPQRVSPATIDAEFEQCVSDSINDAAFRARLTLTGRVGWDGWDAVDRLVARYPGNVLRHPGLDPRPPEQRKDWYPTPEERERLEREAADRAKGRHVAESLQRGRPDWAVDGGGA